MQRANLSKGRDAKPRVYSFCYDRRAAEVNPHSSYAVSPCLFGLTEGYGLFLVHKQLFGQFSG